MTKKEYAKAELENSKRIFKSVTPKYTVDWWIKWIASIILLCAAAFRSSGVAELAVYDMILSWIGCALWCVVGIMWKDRAVTLLNGAVAMLLFSGLISAYVDGRLPFQG